MIYIISSQKEVFVQLDTTSRKEGEISKPEYKRVVEDVLGITPDFLGEKTHTQLISERIQAAYRELFKCKKLVLKDTLSGFDRCMNLGGSIAVVGSGKNLEKAITYIEEQQVQGKYPEWEANP